MTMLGIGIPVYNDQESIGKAIDCILSQTFQDFEIHIYDNCSNDNTIKIAQEYASKDKRIFVHQNTINIGMASNFNRCIALKNYKNYKYISIKSANDLLDSTYYEKCINFLEENKDFCLCYSEGTNTASGAQPIYSYEQDDIYERIKEIISTQGVGNMNYGVLRTNIIDKIVPIKHIQGFDHIFFLNLAMLGKLKKLDEVLYDREPPVNRTEEGYRISCCSTISQRIIAIPHFVDLILGYIEFCNECFLNGLDRKQIIEMVIDISLQERYDIIAKHYSNLKNMIKVQNNLDDNDLIVLKESFHKLRHYLLKNKKFASKHTKDKFQDWMYQLNI